MTIDLSSRGSSPELPLTVNAPLCTVKMNIDTDTQWAYWDGIRTYAEENYPYLQAHIMYPSIHASIHACIHACIHTCIHTDSLHLCKNSPYLQAQTNDLY